MTVNRREDGWMDGWMDGWGNGCIIKSLGGGVRCSPSLPCSAVPLFGIGVPALCYPLWGSECTIMWRCGWCYRWGGWLILPCSGSDLTLIRPSAIFVCVFQWCSNKHVTGLYFFWLLELVVTLNTQKQKEHKNPKLCFPICSWKFGGSQSSLCSRSEEVLGRDGEQWDPDQTEAWSSRALCERRILNSFPTFILTGSQWRADNKGELWSLLVAGFWIKWKIFRELFGL